MKGLFGLPLMAGGGDNYLDQKVSGPETGAHRTEKCHATAPN